MYPGVRQAPQGGPHHGVRHPQAAVPRNHTNPAKCGDLVVQAHKQRPDQLAVLHCDDPEAGRAQGVYHITDCVRQSRGRRVEGASRHEGPLGRLVHSGRVSGHSQADKQVIGHWISLPVRFLGMSEYYIKQKVFSLKDRFSINDASGTPVYFVEGKIISIGSQLTMTDTLGNQVAYIKQKVPTLMPTFEIYVQDRLVVTVRQKVGLRPKFELQGVGWTVQGNWTAHEYDIIDAGGLPQGHVSKKWAAIADTYTVQTPDNAPDVEVLAVVIAIDMAVSSGR